MLICKKLTTLLVFCFSNQFVPLQSNGEDKIEMHDTILFLLLYVM